MESSISTCTRRPILTASSAASSRRTACDEGLTPQDAGPGRQPGPCVFARWRATAPGRRARLARLFGGNDMVAPKTSKAHIGHHRLHPEAMMLSYGFDPELSEGSVKPPVFLTSAFVYKADEEGRDFFDYVSGRKEPPGGA